MRMAGTIAVGIVALLASPAQAELPVVNEARASWQGCDYSIKVRQDVDPDYPYPVPLYRISVQSAVVSPGTCPLTPRTVQLATSKLAPRIAIVVNAEGLAAAYSFGEYYRGMGNSIRLRIHRLDPSTMNSVRVAGLQGVFVAPNGGGGGPGEANLQGLTLHPGYLEVNGTLYGNSITEDPATVPYPYPIVQGSHFVATYPDFFGSTQQPPQIVTY